MTDERRYVMITRKCLFEVICEANKYTCNPCAVCLYPDTYKTGEIAIDCVVWRSYQESEKERRIRYAQKARLRNEDARSGEQG